MKIDAELKKRIEELISKGENRFDYPSVKNFIDKAVMKLLKEIEKREKDFSLSQAKLEKRGKNEE